MNQADAKPRASSASAKPRKAAARPAAGLMRQTMGAQVAEALRRRIIGGELAGGFQLRQEQLAAEFGISKVPVREALNLLEAEGLVTQQFHRGAVVAGISLEEIKQNFELRDLIEGWLVGLACARATAEDVKEASRRAAAIGKSRDPAVLPRLNWEFHRALYSPAGKDHVLDHVHKLHLRVERFVKMQVQIAGIHVDDVVSEHAELLDLYTRRDPALPAALHRHIIGSAERLLERLGQPPCGGPTADAAAPSWLGDGKAMT